MSVLSGVYGRAAQLRRAWYGRHPHRVRHLARPVISVGNLVLGGSGKTPVVAALAARAISVAALLPVISTSLFVAAAVLAAIGWPQRKSRQQTSVTYWDVACALILIGIGAAALVDPEQLVNVTMGPRTP